MVNESFIDALGHNVADKRIDILRGIAASGSISQAARDAGVSYKAAWQALATLTNLAGVALVERAVGGAGGGGATLTADGQRLLQLADAMARARHAVQQGTGPAAAEAALARLAVRTSMRNQFPVVLTAIERNGPVVRVHMHVGHAAQRIAARITHESAQLLGLVEGMAAIALCKATAVRVASVADAVRAGGGNRLEGVVASVARGGQGSDEITIALDGGMQLVGFAGARTLRTRQRAAARVDESALVLALPG